MTKFEFLGDLSRLIADLPQDEREQAMEYYEDYFADAGPEKEQEIIKDFISPAYIAEQLREASARRQRILENRNRQQAMENAARQNTGYTQQPASQMQSMTQPAPQAAPQTVSQTQTMTAPPPQTAPQTVSQTQPMTAASPQAAPQTVSQTQPMMAPPPQTAPQADSAPPSVSDTAPSENASMRNPIFQQASEDDSKKTEEQLALKKKTKVDIKTINATTAQVDKKQTKANAKQAAAEEKQHSAELYSSSKRAVLAAILIITCPISLSVLALIAGLCLLGIGMIAVFVLLGVAAIVASIGSLLLCILSLLTMHIPNCIFTLGSALLLFSAGVGICYADFKLATRAVPGAYFNVTALFNNIKSALIRFTLK